jgi:hypothetical protein
MPHHGHYARAIAKNRSNLAKRLIAVKQIASIEIPAEDAATGEARAGHDSVTMSSAQSESIHRRNANGGMQKYWIIRARPRLGKTAGNQRSRPAEVPAGNEVYA